MNAGRICLSREFNDAELTALTSLFEEELAWYESHEQEARDFLGTYFMEGVPPARQAAWVAIARAIVNLDEFITRE